MSMIEAECTRCGEIFVPHGVQPEDLIHGQTEAEEECGGIGIIQGHWITKEELNKSHIDRMIQRHHTQMETHGKAEPHCEDPNCVWHHPDKL